MPGAKHWSVTPSGRLLSSLTVFIYQKFESSAAEGGWREFFNSHCDLFMEGQDEGGQGQNLECYNLFKQFEGMLEETLMDFAKQEGKEVHEIHSLIGELDEANSKASKVLKRLLHAFEYSKFSQLMRDRAKIREDLAADTCGPSASAPTSTAKVISVKSEGKREDKEEPTDSRDYKRESKVAWV